MANPKSILKECRKLNGMRNTPERNVIIEEIYRKDKHFSIDNLYMRIRNRYPNIKLAKASIYRTIPHLINAGLIRESYVEEGHVCYEKTLGNSPHEHMRCLKCGKILEFYDKGIEKEEQSLCRRRNFKIVRHTFLLEGYCEKCNLG